MDLPTALVIKDATELGIDQFVIKDTVVVVFNLLLLLGLVVCWIFKANRAAFHSCSYSESRLNFLSFRSQLNLD